ncbi:MAG: putative cysteine cluster protein YcgN (CxxCxxCC family) [Flavobacteriales bacterium]|jgi:uncharacterized cysteine cluster protein YcgN (CxxCxxCC family)
MSKAFWKEKTLEQMNDSEWESLCDGCALCCLVKLEDEDSGDIAYTDVVCKYLNMDDCSCTDYKNRSVNVPECVSLNLERIQNFHWLPETCAYRLVSQGDDLPAWHHLITGEKATVHVYGPSVKDRAIVETQVHPDELQDRVLFWVDPKE